MGGLGRPGSFGPETIALEEAEVLQGAGVGTLGAAEVATGEGQAVAGVGEREEELFS